MTNQFPIGYINDLVKSGCDLDDVLTAIFRSAVSPEESEELAALQFIFESKISQLPNEPIYSLVFHYTDQ